MSFITNMLDDMRAEGRSVDNTVVELFRHLEDRVVKLEDKILGKDAPKAPPPKPAPKAAPAPAPAPPIPLDTKSLAATPGPAPSPKAQAKAVAETTALQEAAASTTQTSNLSEEAAGKGDGPSMAPVPLPNTDPVHPANPADPVKMTAGVGAVQIDDETISDGKAMPKSDPLVAANTDVEAKTDPRKPADKKA